MFGRAQPLSPCQLESSARDCISGASCRLHSGLPRRLPLEASGGRCDVQNVGCPIYFPVSQMIVTTWPSAGLWMCDYSFYLESGRNKRSACDDKGSVLFSATCCCCQGRRSQVVLHLHLHLLFFIFYLGTRCWVAGRAPGWVLLSRGLIGMCADFFLIISPQNLNQFVPLQTLNYTFPLSLRSSSVILREFVFTFFTIICLVSERNVNCLRLLKKEIKK